MNGKRRERPASQEAAHDPPPCTGELVFATAVGRQALNLDCVLDFGEEGRLPVTLAVELPENRGMALFQEALIQRWVDEYRHVEATLHVQRERSRVTLAADESTIVLPLRTATKVRRA